MKTLAALLLVAGSALAAPGNPAPDFGWDGAGGKLNSLKDVRGSSVCLLVARSAKDKEFREEAKRLEEMYQEFAARKVVFAAAFLEDPGYKLPSNIPFAVASNGAGVIADYGVKDDFNIVIINPAGGIDLQTNRVIPASRLRDMVISNASVQGDERKPPAEETR